MSTGKKTSNMKIIKNSLGQSHELILKAVKEGDTVVDATAGNGNDTLFLASIVGSSGKVYSFDIQQKAIEKTKKLLEENSLLDERVILINGSHHEMAGHINGKVRAVMFNLGYLPGGDHSIATNETTTIGAIEQAMELLEVNGIITIVVYYGGDSGYQEKNEVCRWIENVDNKKYTVMKTEFVNQVNCPPILICLERLF